MDYLPINKHDNPNDIQKSHNEVCIAQMSDQQIEGTLSHFENKWNISTDDISEHFREKFINERYLIWTKTKSTHPLFLPWSFWFSYTIDL